MTDTTKSKTFKSDYFAQLKGGEKNGTIDVERISSKTIKLSWKSGCPRN
jgi:hypothetical protein